MFGYTILMVIATLGMLAQSSTASPTADVSTAFPTAGADNSFAAWGQFCNDLTCDDCGAWVDLSNSGCLEGETGRQTVNIKSNGPNAVVALVVSSPILTIMPFANGIL